MQFLHPAPVDAGSALSTSLIHLCNHRLLGAAGVAEQAPRLERALGRRALQSFAGALAGSLLVASGILLAAHMLHISCPLLHWQPVGSPLAGH